MISGRLLHGAQHVEALHVAAAFPDRVDRRLAEQPRERAVLHHAAAADALHRLVGVARRALADPVFADRRAQADQQILVRVGAVVHRARDAHRQRERAFALEHQVGEHVAHQRLLVQHLAEGRADRAVVQRLRHRRALAGRRSRSCSRSASSRPSR